MTADPLGALAAGLGAMAVFDEAEEAEEHHDLESQGGAGSEFDGDGTTQASSGWTPSHRAVARGEPKGEGGEDINVDCK